MSDLPSVLRDQVAARLGLGGRENITRFAPVAGGCINNGGKLSTTTGTFFIKWNKTSSLPGMFDAEARGLALLSEARAIRIPNVVAAGEHEGTQWLVLEWIEPSSRASDYWHTFGQQLAALHKVTHTHHGLDHNNYIGSLHQQNDRTGSWIDFFIQSRLDPQLRLAVDKGRADRSLVHAFETLYARLPSMLPEEAPSLLHGDLWNGNLMTASHGEPCLIDPAVYFGNREMDLAMTRLFGGFDIRFYDAYQEAHPLQPGSASRVDIYNLYPLMVHVNLFGGGYTAQVKQILRQLG